VPTASVNLLLCMMQQWSACYIMYAASVAS